jgi:hypothetical protein
MMLHVTVIGYSGSISASPVKELHGICEEVGRTLARHGHVVMTGGRDGVMELVSRAVSKEGGRVIGVLPAGDEGNTHNEIRIRTGMDFALRSLILTKSADVVISIGGQAGTLLEIISSYSYGHPVILMGGTGGWTDRIGSVLIDGKYLDERRTAEVKRANSIEDLERLLEEAENGKV